MMDDHLVTSGIFTPNEVKEIVNGGKLFDFTDIFVNTSELHVMPQVDINTGTVFRDSKCKKHVHKKRELTIDELVEAQWGNRQSILRSAVNRFWKKKLKRQKYI